MSALINCKTQLGLKYVTFCEAKVFYNKYVDKIIDYEFRGHSSHNNFKFTFNINMQNEILDYWDNNNFCNLTLNFINDR